MKRFYLLLSLAVIAAVQVVAQRRSADYYIDFQKSSEKIFFEYDGDRYVVKVAKIDSEFKIYSSLYDAGASNQDQYIFGGADGQGGITPDTVKKLSHPGNNISIEGGGTLYGVTFIFDPEAMTLTIEGGSRTPTESNLQIVVTNTFTDNPVTGGFDFRLLFVTTPDYPTPDSYTVTATYTDYYKEPATEDAEVSAASSRGTFKFNRLVPAEINYVTVTATGVSNGQTFTDTTTVPIAAPGLPILIGQINGHEWQPDYGIHGHLFTKIADGMTYYYNVDLVGAGEFSFVTKLGTTSTDWDTVNKFPRYAPAAYRQAAPLMEWMDYLTFDTGTENAWYPENFEPGSYVVEFNYATQEIAVVKGDIPTGVADVDAEATPSHVDVYSISGVMVRQGVEAATATDGLPQGLYIVGGKKIAVR